MGKEKLSFEEMQLANILRNEVLKSSQTFVQPVTKKVEMSQFELISKNETEKISQNEVEQPYVSPIFSMSEDEILCFVEEFDINELKTLSVAELNHIGRVLGVDPKILVEGED